MFVLVDAFTDTPFAGNPAGVCLLEDEYPSSSKLQEIAAYFNWSEIAFLKKLDDDVFQIRWFSPLDEAPLCGHATLAAAHALFQKGLVNSNKIVFKYNKGYLEAFKDNDSCISMKFPIKQVEKTDLKIDTNKLFGIKKYKQIYRDDLLIIIELESHEDVFSASPNFNEIKKIDCRAICLTSSGFNNYDFVSRYFAPSVGIFEDPVCGSAHCRLSYIWSQKLSKNEMIAYQASKRSGILKLQKNDDHVIISGNAITICELDINNRFALY